MIHQLLLTLKVIKSQWLILAGLFMMGLFSQPMYAQQTATIFYDDFSDNKNNWADASNNSDGASFDIRNGKYRFDHYREKNSWIVSKSIYIDDSQDYSIEASLTKERGILNNGYGILWGRKDSDNQLEFMLSGDGHFKVLMRKNDEAINLAKWTKSGLINTGNGSTNKVEIRKTGSQLKFYINETFVFSTDNQPLFGKRLGFFIYKNQGFSCDYLKVTSTRNVDLNLSQEGWTKTSFFKENYNDNYNSWPVSSSNSDGASFDLRGGRYYFTHKKSANSWITSKVVEIQEWKNFSIECAFRKENGILNNGYGLIFGRKDNQNQFEFMISGDGYFKVLKRSGGNATEVKKWTLSSAINQGNGSTNKLAIIKIDNDFSFYINDIFVAKMPYQAFFGNRLGYVIYNDQGFSADYLYVDYLEERRRNDPPTIAIYEPEISRGFKVVKEKMIGVYGRAEDGDGIYEVVINGIEASLSADGTFRAQVPLAIGSNTIAVKATDTKMKSTYQEFEVKRQQEASERVAEKRLALVIGNANYEFGGSLRNPVNDARAMQTSLEGLGFKVLKYENCNQSMVKRAIDEFGRQLADYDIGLFFYAGHGIQVDGLNFLVPVNASLQNKNDVEYDCVRADRVLAKMESAGSQTNIVILDACRDNPFERSWSRSTKGGGLAFMNAPKGSLIAYATSPGNTASDGSGSNGLYTEALLEEMKKPDVTILQMFQRVRGRVMDSSQGKQTPWESTSLTGDFYFKY